MTLIRKRANQKKNCREDFNIVKDRFGNDVQTKLENVKIDFQVSHSGRSQVFIEGYNQNQTLFMFFKNRDDIKLKDWQFLQTKPRNLWIKGEFYFTPGYSEYSPTTLPAFTALHNALFSIIPDDKPTCPPKEKKR